MTKKISLLIVCMMMVTSFVGISSSLSNASNQQKTIVHEHNNIVITSVQTQDSVPLLTESPWWDTNWRYRREITIDHTKVAGDLVNFPTLVKTTMNVGKVQNDGDDIVFTTNAGIKLNHEIELFDSVSGELIAWVNINSLSSTDDTILWMYYGNPSCDNQQNSEETWDSNYVAVWHFKETSGNNLADSTINHFTGTANGYTPVSDGYIGEARSFDVNNGEIYVGTQEQFGGMPSYTIETYAYPYSVNGENRIFDRSQSYETNPNTILFLIGYLGDYCLLTNNHDWVESYGHLSANTWMYLTGVYSGSGGEQALYVNGAKVASSTTTQFGPTAGSFKVTIGDCSFGWGYHWNGKLDEMRFSNIARTSQWITSSYNTMNSPSTFMSIGEEENKSAVADFTYTPVNPTDLDSIQFNDKSTDLYGTITSWLWDFGDGNTSTLQNPTHKYADEGTYHVTLTVTDKNGANDSISKDVVVSNVAPTSYADGPYNGTTDYAIQFTGSGSYDPDGVIVSYGWDFGDGNNGSGIQPTHRYSKYGVYNVTLTVTDDDGSTDTDGTLAIINRGTPPIVHLLYPTNGEIVKGNVTVRWYAHDVKDGDNLPIYIYFRNNNNTLYSPFKGNPYSNNGTCEWDTTILSNGSYNLLIEAMDSDGNIGADRSSFQIKNQVQPPQNLPPNKPNKPSGPTNGKPEQEYSYTTSTTDPDGDQVYYLWDWDDGTNSSWLGPYGSGVTAGVTYNWTVKGSYSIKVKAKDVHNASSDWSDPLPITMPYTIKPPFQQFLDWLFQRFPNAFPLLRHLLGY
jgi:PKD repeat protein